MRSKAISGAILALLAIPAAVHAADTMPKVRSGSDLNSEVESILIRDSAIDPNANIVVSTTGNEVHLGGFVDKWSEHYAATQDAFYSGALKVDNHIIVRDAPIASNQAFLYEREPS